jgi:hypothetical protein
VAFNAASPSLLAAINETGASSTAMKSPILKVVSCDAVQMASSINSFNEASIAMSRLEKMFYPFFLTSNIFSSLSITTGLYIGAGRREVWSAQDVKAISDDSDV